MTSVVGAAWILALDSGPSTEASPYTLVAFGAYMIGVFLLGALSHQLLKRGSFLKDANLRREFLSLLTKKNV